MFRLRSEARYGLRYGALGLSAVLAGAILTSDPADARHHRRGHRHVAHHTVRVHHVVRVHHHRVARVHHEGYSPPTATYVLDANSGTVLQSSNPDALRHPASLTKIMTLYLLFERLDAGKIRLDTPLRVSEHASEQAPTKLGLKPGQTIAVEDAIKAIVTRSANDVAVVVAENLGGSEAEFCRLMTQKARSLGMSRTTYVNASGLPDDGQITTAHDQAVLGKAVQDRFPRYYKYFSTQAFMYHGHAIRNHNHLLGSVDGVDGIKTGFTRASGFNLVTSVHRGGRHLVAVVMGGRSAAQRDAHMRELINSNIKLASLQRAHGPIVAQNEPSEGRPHRVAMTETPAPVRADPMPTATINRHPAAHEEPGSTDPIRPLLVKTITYRTAPIQTAALGPMPMLVPVPSAPRRTAAAAEPAPRVEPAPAPASAVTHAPKAAPSAPVAAAASAPKSEPPPAHAHAHGGWMIQIGAFEAESEARQHLTAAQAKAKTILASADPFTERVQKGDKALFRARFAGFDKEHAENACRQLKRSDIVCMALKN
jgi:D-alanyl-D-alanine carboxypeptidase